MSKSISEGDRAFQIIVHNLREGHCTLFFLHSHSHSHNDIGNVYLLFLSKASGTMTVTMTKKQDKNMILYTF